MCIILEAKFSNDPESQSKLKAKICKHNFRRLWLLLFISITSTTGNTGVLVGNVKATYGFTLNNLRSFVLK